MIPFLGGHNTKLFRVWGWAEDPIKRAYFCVPRGVLSHLGLGCRGGPTLQEKARYGDLGMPCPNGGCSRIGILFRLEPLFSDFGEALVGRGCPGGDALVDALVGMPWRGHPGRTQMGVPRDWPQIAGFPKNLIKRGGGPNRGY